MVNVFKGLLLLLVFALAVLAAYVAGYRAGMPKERISPLDETSLDLGGHRIEVTYSRPYVRKREIFGRLVPYGKVWRTGANEATVLSTPIDVRLGGVRVPRGEYSLFTIPTPDAWTLIVNRQTGQWGTSYDEARDLARIPMQTSSLPDLVEQLTIRFEPAGDAARLVIEWEHTRATVRLEPLP